MSLDYGLDKIPDWETTCFDVAENGNKRMTATTECLIFACMFIDMNGITEKNCLEFFTRLYMYERCCGAVRRANDNGEVRDIYYTMDEVKSHVGLGTNVSGKPKSYFLKTLWERVERERKEIHSTK